MVRIALMFCLLMAASSAFADTSIINIYDANGNLVTGDGRYYEYNDANQLVQVRQGDTITGPVIAEYFYDASGQRVKKIENGVVTYYVGKHFEKQVGGANEGSTSYYFGDDGERVAKKDPAGNIFYYHLDHLDGINAVTDSAGTIVAKTDYLPFGELRNGSSGTEKYSYTGKEKDKTDLYYFDARYNSPEFKHFTQADIAEPDYDDPQDLNRYSYVGNNPLSYVDYDGYKKKKKKHLSKREQRARSLGLNPDKDKYKVGKWSHKEYKHALSEHRKSQQKASQASSHYSAASKQKYSLTGVGSAGGSVLFGTGNSGNDAVEFPNTYMSANNISDEDRYSSQMINKGMKKFNNFLNRNILSLPEHIPYAGCAFIALNGDPAVVARGEKKLKGLTSWITGGILKTNPQFFIKLGEGRVLAFELEEIANNAEEKIKDWGVPLDALSCVE